MSFPSAVLISLELLEPWDHSDLKMLQDSDMTAPNAMKAAPGVLIISALGQFPGKNKG